MVTVSLWSLVAGLMLWAGGGWLDAGNYDAAAPTELVVIDAAVAQPQTLIAQLQPHQQAVLLPTGEADSLTHLTQILSRYRHLKALHLIAHGRPGQMQLGQTLVDRAALMAHGAQLRQWRQAFTPQADILVYGCEVAADEAGIGFVKALQQLTQADVAASSNLTGSAQFRGDWRLEVQLGQLETPVAVAHYDGVLQQLRVTTTADEGDGSLRWAIAQANATPDDDLIDLSGVSGAIALHRPLPAITGNLVLMGNGDSTISGSGSYRVLQVDDGEVTLRDVTLADGLAQGRAGTNGSGGSAGMGGGLLINRGAVRLSHVTFVDNQAIGGSGSQRMPPAQIQIQSQGNRLKVNRGAIIDIDGVSYSPSAYADATPLTIDMSRIDAEMQANRGAIAGVNGVGINGIGAIAFGGGGGFGGFGNAGNGGNGGNGGAHEGNGGNGGDGGDGGVGIFGSFARWQEDGSIGTIAFGGGGGFGGFGNAGNGGNGGNATAEIANGGDGGNGGNGGFGGGGGAGGDGGAGGYGGAGRSSSYAGNVGKPGHGGFAGGDGGLGYGGGGGGLGGAVFIRSGSLLLNQVQFIHNMAIAGDSPAPGEGKGGAIFIAPDLPTKLATAPPELGRRPNVLVLGRPLEFIDNVASDGAGLPTDNDDVYGAIVHF